MADTMLTDADARRTIAAALDATLFVEAGAGSGKTTALVSRLLALVEAGHDLAATAAITFTEKAAAELRDRVRIALEQAAEPAAGRPPPVVERCRRAIDALDAAAISTLHAFAQRLLREHPVEAGLPPVVEVMDEIGSQVAFEERWNVFRERLFTEPALERVVLLAFSLGVRLSHLEDIAAAFDADWDLIDDHVVLDAADPAPFDITALLAVARETALLRGRCRFDDDRLAARLDAVDRWCADIAAVTDDEIAVVESLTELDGGWRVGRKENWDGHVDEVRDAGRRLGQLAAQLRADLVDGCLRRISAEVARFTLAAAEDRRRHGQLQFHDLLVLARELLRGPHAGVVRATLHRRYQHLLLDEFQDTDPIQIELALRITAPPTTDAPAWPGLQAEPGRLFVVGDPKQSIYRFRRADVGLFLAASDAIGGGDPLQLHSNFRTVTPVVEWVNHVFGTLIQAAPGVQPPFRPLSPVRPPAPGAAPAVAVIGLEPHHDDDVRADDVREREATGIAATIATALRDGWLVADRTATGEERWRAARPGDIAVLLPARTSLASLQQALDAVGVPHRAESSSLVYATPEVRALLMAARAVDDPTDELAVVSTLRSSLFGCSDRDLFGWVQRGGAWSALAPLPPPLPDQPDPVHDAMTSLATLTGERAWRSPSELLAHLVSSRRVLELGTVGGRPHDLWRRIRFVIDQARAWSEAGGTGLRAYLHWAARQRSDGTRAAEVVLPETDLDAVRIMTIHAAKGLEFPITVVSGLSTLPRRPPGGGRVIWTPGGYEVKAGSGITTARYDDALALDEQLDHHERIRLLYVACTRARDHLVVSLHRTDAHDAAAAEAATSATLLARERRRRPRRARSRRPRRARAGHRHTAPAGGRRQVGRHRRVGGRARPRAGGQWAPAGRRRHRLGPRCRTPPRARRPRPPEGPARPRAPPVAEGALRHRGRPRRARRAADRRPRHRSRPAGGGCCPSCRRGRARPGRRRRGPRRCRARCARGPGGGERSALARGLRGRSGRRHVAGGLRGSALPRRRRSRRGRLQDRPPPRRAVARGSPPPLPPPGRRLRAGRGAGHPGARGPVRVRVLCSGRGSPAGGGGPADRDGRDR